MPVEAAIAAPGTYARYKNDTAVFLTWLLRTAKECGYRYAAARTASTTITLTVADITYPVSEILVQARTISIATTACQVPRGVVKRAEHAIKLRQAYTSYHRSLRRQADADVNDSHAHFAGTLEEALNMLKQKVDVKPRRQPSVASPSKAANRDADDLSSQFPSLKPHPYLGDDDDDGLDEAACREITINASDPDDASSNSRSASSRTEARSGNGQSLAEETRIRVFCFFQDLTSLRQQVAAAWDRYVNGDADLISVSMATNVAIAFAEQLEKDLLGELFGHPLPPIMPYTFVGLPSSYAAIVGKVFQSHSDEALETGYGVDLRVGMVLAPETDVIRCKYAFLLNRMSGALCARKDSKDSSFFDLRWQLEREDERTKPFNIYLAILGIKLSLIVWAEDVETFLEDEGVQALDNLDELLVPIISSIFLRDEMLEASSQAPRTRRCDAITSAVRNLENGCVGAAALLSVAILDDLNTILDAHSRQQIFEALQGCVKQSKTFVSLGSDNELLPNVAVWLSADLHAPATIANLPICADANWDGWKSWHELADLSIDTSRVPDKYLERLPVGTTVPKEQRSERLELLKACPWHHVPCPSSISRCWTSNPVSCGTMMYNLDLAREQAGICLANYQLTILATAYLYIAFRNRNLLHGHWSDMEAIIEVHGEAMFFGPPPSDNVELYRRWNLRANIQKLKAKILSGGSGGDRTGRQPVRIAGASCLSTSDVADVFCQYFEDKETFIRAVHAVNKIWTQDKTKQSKRKHSQRTLDPTTFLEPFLQYFADDCRRLSIDYVALTTACNKFLAHLQNEHLSGKPRLDEIPEWMLDTVRDSDKPGRGYGLVSLVESLFCLEAKYLDMRASLRHSNAKIRFDQADPVQKIAKHAQRYLDERKMLVAADNLKKYKSRPGKLTLSFKRSNATRAATVEEVQDEEYAHSLAVVGHLTLA